MCKKYSLNCLDENNKKRLVNPQTMYITRKTVKLMNKSAKIHKKTNHLSFKQVVLRNPIKFIESRVQLVKLQPLKEMDPFE